MNLASDIKHENYENGILFNYDYDSDYAYHYAYRFAFIYYPFKKNKQYRLSWKTQNLGEIPQSLQYYFPEFEQYLTLNNAFTPQNDTNWIAIFVKNDDFVEGCKVAITDVMLTEGSEIKPYEQYGVSPSPDYPSEIETVNGSVEIDVVNKNVYSTELVYGNIIESTGKKSLYNSRNYFCCTKESIRVDSNTKYFYQAMHKKNHNWVRVFEYDCKHNFLQRKLYQFDLVSSKLTFNFTTLKDTKYIDFVTVAESDITNLAPSEIIIETIRPTSEYEEHQSQTAIMPIQQEMLEGDYVADVEHHEWGKIESYNGENITTNYISTTGELSTGATVYYKLTTPVDLELTSEQKAVRDTKLYTYKNITNIDVSDELASIDVTYKKDLETMFNNIIKQIPSSTSDKTET